MFLYALFLIYPGVSSTVLRHYVCKDVFGTRYLLAGKLELQPTGGMLC